MGNYIANTRRNTQAMKLETMSCPALAQMVAMGIKALNSKYISLWMIGLDISDRIGPSYTGNTPPSKPVLRNTCKPIFVSGIVNLLMSDSILE